MRISAKLINRKPPRWRIEDSDTHRFWTGQDFDPDEEMALVYEEIADLPEVIQRICRRLCKKEGMSLTRFIVPIMVEVYHKEPVCDMDVARYLAESSHLWVDTEAHGTGPDGSVVLTTIEWQHIEKENG